MLIMAFPTTQMSGYGDLRGRIVLALSRCQEQPWLDFKESQPWQELRWRLLKTIMGMANLRDGGLILVGVAERGTTWDLTGIEPGHLGAFDYDDIIDQLSKYASPHVSVDIAVHDHDDGKRYLAFHVHQFSDSPVVCRNNSPDDVRPKDRLAAGEVYVRPTTGKPQTVKVTDAAHLHDLLELAAEFRARRMLEIGKRVGLVPGETSTSLYDAELATITEMPVPVKDYPHWTVTFRPETYTPDLIPSLTDCLKLVEKARVQLRGWSFPHLSNRETDRSYGSDWIGSWASFMGEIEYWQLFQSGQFAHFAAVIEVVDSNWREKLQQEAMSHLRHRQDIDWNAVPGYISLVNLVYTVTEYFEFAARICQAGVYRGGLAVSLELTGIRDFVLTTDWNRSWSHYRPATDNRLHKTWRVSSEKLVAGSAEHSIKAIVWLCECFGWMSPNVEAIKKDQVKLLSGNL
jgi:Putative DNA-binding domain